MASWAPCTAMASWAPSYAMASWAPCTAMASWAPSSAMASFVCLFRSGGPRPVFLSVFVLRGLQSAHPPSPVELLRRGTRLPGGGSYVRVLLCVMCSRLMCPYLVCFLSFCCISAVCTCSLVWTVLELKCSAWHTVKLEYAVGCISSDCSLAWKPEGKSYPSVG